MVFTFMESYVFLGLPSLVMIKTINVHIQNQSMDYSIVVLKSKLSPSDKLDNYSYSIDVISKYLLNKHSKN